MSGPIVEIRDYTIEADWLEAYRKWAEEIAAPWLKQNLDVIDFWMDCSKLLPPFLSKSIDVEKTKISLHEFTILTSESTFLVKTFPHF